MVRPRSPRSIHPSSVVFALVVALLPCSVWAGGYEYPVQGTHALGRGGAFVAKADDPSALYWNPGKLSLLRGTRFLYNHNLADLSLTFERASTEGVDFAPVSEQDGFFPLGASIIVTSDFGLDDWTFAAGIVGPSSVGQGSYPDDGSGPTRYTFLEKDLVMIHYTASVAWKYEQLFGFGLSLQYADLSKLKYTFEMSGRSDMTNSAVNNDWDLRSTLDMTDHTGFSAILGGWFRPWRFLELGASARVLPIWIDAEGDIVMSRSSNDGVIFGEDVQDLRFKARTKFQFPMSAKVGARYVHMDGEREVFDVEVDFEWENWSALRAYEVTFIDKPVDLWGVVEIDLEEMELVRGYEDTYSVRLGGQWNAIPEHLTIRLGGLWESAALPKSRSVTDFPSFERWGVAGGLSGAWGGFELSVAYAHIFQLDRCACDGEASLLMMDPGTGTVLTGPATNEGFYESSYDVISVGLVVHFDEVFGDRESRQE